MNIKYFINHFFDSKLFCFHIFRFLQNKTSIFFILSLLCLLSLSAYAVRIPGPFDNIVQDGTGHGNGFIVPNEFNYLSFTPSLRDKQNVLISVGTFRAFQAAAVGNFQYAIFMDYAQEVTLFNHYLAGVIKNSSNRLDFLDQLFEYKNVTTALDNRNESIVINSLALNQHSNRNSDRNQFLKAMIRIYQDDKTKNENFLTSDYLFEKLKVMIQEDRIKILNGSLSGKDTMLDLAYVLRQNKLTVSVLDISNALDYIVQYQEFNSFLANVSRLPMSPDASVLFTLTITGNFKIAPQVQNGWVYLDFPIEKYKAYLNDLFKIRPYKLCEEYLNILPTLIPLGLPPMRTCHNLY